MRATNSAITRELATLGAVLRAANRAVPVPVGRLTWAAWDDAGGAPQLHVVHSFGQGYWVWYNGLGASAPVPAHALGPFPAFRATTEAIWDEPTQAVWAASPSPPFDVPCQVRSLGDALANAVWHAAGPESVLTWASWPARLGPDACTQLTAVRLNGGAVRLYRDGSLVPAVTRERDPAYAAANAQIACLLPTPFVHERSPSL